MRATRGFLASFGAGLSLIVAGTVALTFCSAIIAYKGWPGVRVQRTDDERALVAAVQGDPAGGPARVSLRLPAPSGSRHRAGDQRAVFASSSSGRTHGARAVVAAVQPRGSVAALGAAPGATAGNAGGTGPNPTKTAKKFTVPAAGQAVSTVGSTLGDAVTRTGQALGDAVKPAAPTVATTLSDTAAAAGKAVTDTANSVGQTVDGLVKP